MVVITVPVEDFIFLHVYLHLFISPVTPDEKQGTPSGPYSSSFPPGETSRTSSKTFLYLRPLKCGPLKPSKWLLKLNEVQSLSPLFIHQPPIGWINPLVRLRLVVIGWAGDDFNDAASRLASAIGG